MHTQGRQLLDQLLVEHGRFSGRGQCAGYLEHLLADLDVLHFVERAFLSKHPIGTYNHYGSESIVVLSTLIKERFLWRFVWSSPSFNEFASALTRFKNVSCIGSNYRRPHLCSARSLISQGEIGTDRGKRALTTTTHHPPSTDQTIGIPKDGPASPGVTGQNGSGLETGALPRPARDFAALASGAFPRVLEAQVSGRFSSVEGIRRNHHLDQRDGGEESTLGC